MRAVIMNENSEPKSAKQRGRRERNAAPSKGRDRTLVTAGVEADVVVAARRTAQEHAVRMESSGGERGGLVALEEA